VVPPQTAATTQGRTRLLHLNNNNNNINNNNKNNNNSQRHLEATQRDTIMPKTVPKIKLKDQRPKKSEF
jgi:hypothetical protein